MSSVRLGFVGLGLMGDPMTRRLLGAGFPVTVWNRSPAKHAPLVAAGARAAESLGALVREVDVVMLCISDTDAVREVVHATDGILENARADQLVVDFSSIEPAVTRELAALLRERTGAGWVDAPVSGGVPGAENGTLAIMAGGEVSDVERLRPLAAPLCQRLTHVGPVGSGQVTKVINQMIVACNVLVIAEAMALAKETGVDGAKIPEALRGGFADSIPLQLVAPRMASGTFEPVKWRVKTLLKDLDTAVKLSRDHLSSTPMSGIAAQLMRLHASQGFAELDPSTLVTMYAKEP